MDTGPTAHNAANVSRNHRPFWVRFVSAPCVLSLFLKKLAQQVFIPSVGVEYESTHHADILCTLGPMMNETEWKEKGLDNYGLIAVNSEGNAAQVIDS